MLRRGARAFCFFSEEGVVEGKGIVEESIVPRRCFGSRLVLVWLGIWRGIWCVGAFVDLRL